MPLELKKATPTRLKSLDPDERCIVHWRGPKKISVSTTTRSQQGLSFVISTLMLWSVGFTGPVEVAAQRTFPGPEVQDAYIQWPLPRGAERYADIDGRGMHRDVVAQAEIARRYRDEIHPKFWGRIIGFEGDTWAAEWLAGRFRSIGLSDVRIQEFDLVPQWFPRSYVVTVRSGGESKELVSAQPFYASSGTPSGGLDLEAVYVGLGTEADFMGRDVRGKAVFTYSMLGVPNMGATRRAQEKDAAVVFDVHMLPGNARYQAYPSGATVPTFALGNDDGAAVRDLIAAAPAGQPVRVNVQLEVERVPNLQTALVWGTLPGATDETIYVTAHRDGWFDASGDNASGVASMIGLAEHYAKIPQAQRPRTMVFVGLDGHHNSGEGSWVGIRWMMDNREQLFGKTALMINAEHPSTVQTIVRPRYKGEDADLMMWGNTYMPQQWYAGGLSRPELDRIARAAFREFGMTHYLEPEPGRPPATDMGFFWWFLPGVVTSEYHHYFHTDLETPETVPWTGLEASTRAYARIIDEVNKLPLSALQRPEEPSPF